MGKFIAGIIAVLCLHIGFAAYIANQNDADQSLTAKSSLTNASEFALRQPSLIASDPADTEAGPTTVQAHTPKPVNRGAMRRSDPPANLFTRYVVPATRNSAHAQPKITQAKNSTIVSNSTIAAFTPASALDKKGKSTGTDRRPEKRSFIAAAMPVIKKPWDWLKAVRYAFR